LTKRVGRVRFAETADRLAEGERGSMDFGQCVPGGSLFRLLLASAPGRGVLLTFHDGSDQKELVVVWAFFLQQLIQGGVSVVALGPLLEG
jgi:hypothetical protein